MQNWNTGTWNLRKVNHETCCWQKIIKVMKTYSNNLIKAECKWNLFQ